MRYPQLLSAIFFSLVSGCIFAQQTDKPADAHQDTISIQSNADTSRALVTHREDFVNQIDPCIEYGFSQNPLSVLTGKLSGLYSYYNSGVPGGAVYLMIRGPLSFWGDQQPLIVIDGLPIDNSQFTSGNPDIGTNTLFEGVSYSNRAIDLNQDDIDYIEVIKGGAASIRYGLRGANGAILIHSKKNLDNTETARVAHIAFTSLLDISQAVRLPAVQNMYGQGSNGSWLGPETGSPYSWGPRLDSCSYTNVGLSAAQDVDADGIYDWDNNGRIVSIHDPNANGIPVQAYDNIGNLFRTAYTYKNALSISGSKGPEDYYFSSFSNDQGEGVVPHSSFNKTTLRFAASAQLTPKLTASGNAQYTNSGGNRLMQGAGLSGVMSDLLRTSTSFDNSNAYSDPVHVLESYTWTSTGLSGLQRSYRGYGKTDNPYWSINKNQLTDRLNRLFGNVSLSYKPVEWFNLSYRVGTDFYSDRRKAHFGLYSSSAPEGRVIEDQHVCRIFSGDLMLQMTKKLNTHLSADFTLGHQMYQSYHQQLYVEGNVLATPDAYALSNTLNILSRENQSKFRTSGIYGQLDLNYRNAFLVGAGGRYDMSNLTPNGSFFPSMDVGLVLSEIKGMQGSRIFSYGKLRFSYAQLANLPPPYSVNSQYLQGSDADGWTLGISYPFGGYSGFVYGGLSGNTDLRPELTKVLEAGGSFSFFQERFFVDATYYVSHSDGLLMSVPPSGTITLSGPWVNAGNIKNEGYEIAAAGIPYQSANRKVVWKIGMNFSQNHNLVESLAEGVDHLVLAGISNMELRVEAGKSYGSIYGTYWLRDQEGQMIINDDLSSPDYGRPISSVDKSYLGSVLPEWNMGFTTSLKAAGFSFWMNLDIKKGGVVWNGTRGIMTSLGTHADTEDRGESYVFDGVMGHFENGQLISNGNTNTITTALDESWYSGLGGGLIGPVEQFVEKADCFRIRELAISYTFPDKWLAKSFLKKTELFCSVRNLWLWTPYSGVDPETSLFGSNNIQGIDYFNWPSVRSYQIGLKVLL